MRAIKVLCKYIKVNGNHVHDIDPDLSIDVRKFPSIETIAGCDNGLAEFPDVLVEILATPEQEQELRDNLNYSVLTNPVEV